MQDFNHQFQQLPSFIQSELIWYVGSHHGLSNVQILARHIAAADYWIEKKNAHYRHRPDASGIFGNGPLSKQEMEALKARLEPKGPGGGASLMLRGWRSRLTAESIRCLTEFKNSLLPIQVRAQAEEAAWHHAQHQAREAARQLAQRQAEEAARLLAQQQAAEEAARQLARHQAEEASRQLALQQADEAAIRLIQPLVEQAALQQIVDRSQEGAATRSNESAGPIRLMPGPKTLDDVKNAAMRLKTELQTAIADFSVMTNRDKDIPVTDAFSAMLYTFKQTDVDVQKISDAIFR